MNMNESPFSGTTIRTRRSFSWFRTLARPSTTTTTTTTSRGDINGNSKKRDRDDNDIIDCYYCPPCTSSTAVNCHDGEDDDHDDRSAASCRGPRPAKRLRHDGEALMSFDKPYPCAYHVDITVYSTYNGGGCCLFRSTCSYHHGMPVPCHCNEESCPRGHAHRRAPRVCQHASACRWMPVGECSFHHGHAVVCNCHDLTCLRAHADRIVKQVDIRQEIQVQKRQEHNARKLHFAFNGTCKANIADMVHHGMRQAIQIATMAKSNNNNNKSHGSITMGMDSMMDPVETVTFNSQHRFGFISFRTPALATASLLHLNGLLIPNTGRIRLQRPTDYRCSITTTSNSTSNDSIPLLAFDTSRLDIKQIKMSDQSNKNMAKKKDVHELTQTNKDNVTDDPPPTTSARLFRDWLFQTDADVTV